MSLQQRLSIATGEAQAPQDQTRNLLEELLEEPQSEVIILAQVNLMFYEFMHILVLTNIF